MVEFEEVSEEEDEPDVPSQEYTVGGEVDFGFILVMVFFCDDICEIYGGFAFGDDEYFLFGIII